MRRRSFLALAIFVFFMSSFIMVLSDSYAQKKETITIGILAPMSGAGAVWGISMQRGTSLAIQDINNTGGIKVGKKTRPN